MVGVCYVRRCLAVVLWCLWCGIAVCVCLFLCVRVCVRVCGVCAVREACGVCGVRRVCVGVQGCVCHCLSVFEGVWVRG